MSNATAPLKVFIVSSHLKSMGGAEKNLLDLCRGLQGRAQVEVGGMQCGELLNLVRATGVVVHDFRINSLFSVRAAVSAFQFRRLLKKGRFDVVLTYHHDADIWAGLVALSAGVPVVSSRRDMGFMHSTWHIWAYRVLNRFFTRIITVAEAVRQEVIRAQWAPREKISVVHNGITPLEPTVDDAAIRSELSLHRTDRIVGMVANFRPVKGQEYFVKAAVEVARQRDNVQFVVIGDTQTAYFLRVKEMAREAGIDSKFRCVGSRSDVSRILSIFDVFVLSSLQEGFSNALLEAMSVGVPPVASAVGGNPETIQHGRDGFLFPAEDHRALARHLVTLLGDDELRERMGAAAATAVRARFSFDGMIDKVFEVLSEAAGCGTTVDTFGNKALT